MKTLIQRRSRHFIFCSKPLFFHTKLFIDSFNRIKRDHSAKGSIILLFIRHPALVTRIVKMKEKYLCDHNFGQYMLKKMSLLF